MADVSVKLTDTLSVDGVEPAGRTSSRCARDDIVSIQCARVTAVSSALGQISCYLWQGANELVTISRCLQEIPKHSTLICVVWLWGVLD